jgi:sulfur-oxidizing protein SoxB
MNLNRREFLNILAIASANGLAINSPPAFATTGKDALYDLPPFGNASLLHFTDAHAQLLPCYYREPDTNLGAGLHMDRPPHLTGEALLKYFRIPAHTRSAYAFTHLNFTQSARTYGQLGGFAHLATLVKRLRADRPGALLLDGGDSWQGSATALWTQGQDMVKACKLLGVDIMTGHWEFTYGAKRVQEVIENEFAGHIEFLAQNIRTTDFDDPVFKSDTLRQINGARVAIIGQAFPYTPIANPAHFIPDWTFGIQEERLQKIVDSARQRGAEAVVLLSHNGVDVDLKLASRVTGIDFIMGGHTHDPLPVPLIVSNRAGQTVVTNAGSNGKFLSVLDLDVRQGKLEGYRYRLLPVFSRLLPADPEMSHLIESLRAPFISRLNETLARTEGLLYRRGNFNGTFDELILKALLEVNDAEIAFSPGFRWGTTLLPGEAITTEVVMNQTAITYPQVSVTQIDGLELKNRMEDVADNLFNPDPYLQQGGDMVRVGGLTYRMTPHNLMGKRISHMTLHGKPVVANKTYKLASWAPMGNAVQGPPVWDVLNQYLKAHPIIKPDKARNPIN